jgi:uncharacterized membrane protein YhaH (DUF805 family)
MKYWFKAKRYGYGWYPATWQGWLVLAAALVAMVSIAVSIDRHSHSVSDTLIGIVVPELVIIGFLILICALTGEKPRWRWGGKE